MPGAAERIFAQFESQARHRQQLERTVVEGNTDVQKRGNWQAFVIAVLGLGVSALAFWKGDTGAGVAVFVGEVAVLAGLFVYSKERDRNERQANRDQ